MTGSRGAPEVRLIAFIDDATSRLMRVRLCRSNPPRLLVVLKDYVTEFGVRGHLQRPHSIFTKHDPEDLVPTQFERPWGRWA